MQSFFSFVSFSQGVQKGRMDIVAMKVHPFISDIMFQTKVFPHNTEQRNKNLIVFEVTVEDVRKEAMICVCHLCSVAALKCASRAWP